jgi:hypothetical protein
MVVGVLLLGRHVLLLVESRPKSRFVFPALPSGPAVLFLSVTCEPVTAGPYQGVLMSPDHPCDFKRERLSVNRMVDHDPGSDIR